MRSPFRFMNALLLVGLFGMVLAPLFLPLKDGKPILDLDDLRAPKLPSLGSADTPAEPVTVYRWRGADGAWQFGDTPPQGVAYEPVQVDPDVNLMQAVRPAPQTAPQATADTAPTTPGLSPIGYSPERIKQVMDDARSVEGLVQQHKARMDQQLDAIR